MSFPAAPAGARWAPRWSVIGASGAATAVLAAGGYLAGLPGGYLAWAVAALLACLTGYDALARPALAVDAAGLVVRSGWLPRHYPWSLVTRVEVVETRRLLVLRALEIDAGEDLLLLTRRRLGSDLAAVAAVVSAYADARAGRPPTT